MTNINSIFIDHESVIRLLFFGLIFTAVAIAEIFSPRRRPVVSKQTRWINNILLSLTGTVIMRLVFPAFPVGVAVYCRKMEWGLLNLFDFPLWAAVICSIVFLDLIIYVQHKLFHLVPIFWRLHKVHHIDQDIDVTTGLRFHPLEIIVSMIIKITAIALIGAPPAAVVIFEILLNGTTMFNHGNLKLPPAADTLIRLFTVTPDMHRIHHSVLVKETNSNYGFNFPWWDRLFGTYRREPENGHLQMKIGLNGYFDTKYLFLSQMLMTPFISRR